MRLHLSLSTVLRRLPGLMVGLVACGAGVALMARSGLGLGPWEVLNQGISRHTGIPLGTVSIVVGVPVLAAWWPLRQRPGIGTLLNLLTVGTATNLTLLFVEPSDALGVQLALLAAGLAIFGAGSGVYLASGLGPGPRDGLMTGIHRRWGWTIARARTLLELSALAAGFALGGTVGIGTLLFALTIGPMVQLSLRVFDRNGRVIRPRPNAGPVAEGTV